MHNFHGSFSVFFMGLTADRVTVYKIFPAVSNLWKSSFKLLKVNYRCCDSEEHEMAFILERQIQIRCQPHCLSVFNFASASWLPVEDAVNGKCVFRVGIPPNEQP